MFAKPKHYNLQFDVDLKNFFFEGKTTINLQVDEPVKELTLDAAELDIYTCELEGNDAELTFKYLEEEEQLTILFPQELKQGEYKLLITYKGILNDKMMGFYRSKYEENGKEKYLATSQFEAADARRAFPGFDSPGYKATFDITLIVDNHYIAISNMLPKEEKDLGNGKKSVSFHTTPKMSTYLVYLGVGEFEFKEEQFGDILIRGVTTKGNSQYTEFAIDFAKKSLQYYEEYFQFKYPLPKLDLIAIPDFAAGAMENWGAITFRENALLYYPQQSSLATKQRVAEVVAHELTHQWFGNLVTMKWWDDLWLNESFATFMAYKAINHYFPEWDIWSDYLIKTVFDGMALDSLYSSHPIKVEVKHTSEIEELFDEIAYDKGGSVLRMFDEYLGKGNFRNGLRAYIKKYQYQNTEAKNLWECLEQAAKKPVVSLIQSFVTQTGFPVVAVQEKDKRTLQFSQKRFVLEEQRVGQSLWKVPMVIQYDTKKQSHYVLEKRSAEVKLIEDLTFINANLHYASFFITNYSSALLNLFGKHINKIGNKERLGLLHDLYLLVIRDEWKLSEFLSFLNTSYINEKDPFVLTYLIEKLNWIYLLIENEEVKRMIIKFSQKALEQISYEPEGKENVTNPLLRSVALGSLADFDDKITVNFLNTIFQNFINNNKNIPGDLRGVVYANAVRSNKQNYPIIWRLYRESNAQEEKVKLLAALLNTKDGSLLKQTLDYTFTPDVRFAYILYILMAASSNPIGKGLTLDWFFTNFDRIVIKTTGGASKLLGRALKIVLPSCGVGQLQKVEQFLTSHPLPHMKKSISQAMEELRINNRFYTKYKKK